MKDFFGKRTCFIALLLALFAVVPLFSERVYKEIVIDGEKVNKWMELDTITEYDTDGHEVRVQNVRQKSVSTYEYIGKSKSRKTIFSDGSTATEMWQYDEYGRIIYFKFLGEHSFEVWNEYDSIGRIIHEITKKGTESEQSTLYQYNNINRTCECHSADANAAWENEYDENWRIIHRKEYYKMGNGRGRKLLVGAEYWNKFTETGKKLSSYLKRNSMGIINAQGEYIQTGYDEIWTSYNQLEDIIQVKTKKGTTVSNIYYLYEYEYHPNGKLKKKISYYCEG